MRSTALHSRGIILPVLLITGLYGFVLSLTGFKDAWALAFSVEASGNSVQAILNASLSSPYTALLSGVVITSLIQSSSATIAIVVSTVGAGVIGIEDSVYIMMGANIGTTITNTIVGLAHSHQPDEFRRMTPAILVDDIYKVLNVSLFFVIETITGFLSKMSLGIVDFLERSTPMGVVLESFPDLIDLVTEPVVAGAISAIASLAASTGLQALMTGILFFLLLILSLSLMGEALEHYLHDRSRLLLNKVFGGKYLSFGIGFILCWLLQSSSVTVSLILPLVAQSAISLPMVYYYSIGAALATTCDPGQIISYLKFGPIGLTAGMVHILLNIFGAILFLTVPGLRVLPIVVAEHIAGPMGRSRHAPLILLAYVGLLFFGLPLIVIFTGRFLL